MNSELENKLYNLDTIFFQHAIACQEGKETAQQTCMVFGCQCGDGWYQPIKKFVKKVAILNNLGKKTNIKFVCDQLKEKYGEIRIYGGIRKIDQNIKQNNDEFVTSLNEMYLSAEKQCQDDCWNTCQWCGAEGGNNGQNMVTTCGGWISRICKKCAKQKQQNSVKHNDQLNNQKYIPRICGFIQGYQFLSIYDIQGFKYQQEYYSSIIQAFYILKDPKHAELYKQIFRIFRDNLNCSKIVQKIGKEFGIQYQDKDYSLLKSIVRAKFSYEYHKGILQQLFETINMPLNNWNLNHDTILGICHCKECDKKQNKNIYGKILMEVRDELYKENDKETYDGQVGWKNGQYYIANKVNDKIQWKELKGIDYIKWRGNNPTYKARIIINGK